MEQTESSEKKQKTSKSRRETAVQGTNDNSIVSKCSMSAAGYFHDAFLKKFVAKNSKRAPLINRGYYLRAVCIDQVLRHFLSKNQGCTKQVVSLGAGFDSAYFRLKAEGLLQDTSFYEIDFPEVVKRKHAIIQSNSELSDLLNCDEKEKKVVPPIELSTKDYCLLGVDLTQLNTLEAALRLCGADFDTPTLLLSECVMTYMTRRCSSALVKWAGETFQDAIFVMFEQINPDDAFGIFMQNHFHTIGSPLKCITSFPIVESQIKRFLDLGWQKCKCHDLNEMYRHTLSPEERARIETLDPFDEYEEFNLKCAHYFVLVASTSSSIADFLFSTVTDSSTLQPAPVGGHVMVTCVPSGTSSVKRFSHSSVLVADRYVITAGGFGEVDGRHQRVQEVSVTDTSTMETRLVRCHSEDIQYSRMHHTAVVLSDGRVLLCAGRQSPFFLCTQLLVLKLEIHAGSERGELDSPTNLNNGDTRQRTACAGLVESGSEKDKESSTSRNGDRGSEESHAGVTAGNSCDSREERNSEQYDQGNSVRNRGDMDGVHNCAACAADDLVCDNHIALHPTPSPPSNQPQAPGHKIETRSNPGNMGQNSTDHLLLPTEREETTDFEGGQLTCSVLQQSGDVPCPRWRHATSVVKIEGRECVFLHGGRTQKAEVLADSYLLDICTGVWTKVTCKGDDPGALHSHTMVAWGEGSAQRIVLVGGMDGDQHPQSHIYLLDVASHTWQRLSIIGVFLARYSHTCHVTGDKLVAVGGVNLSRHTPGVGIVNLNTGEAQEFSFPSVSRNQLLMYHRHSSVMLPDQRVAVLGGGGNCFSFGTHLNRTPVVLDISKCLAAVS